MCASCTEFDSTYDEFLPSLNVAFNVTDNIVTRLSASRTLTRANPNAMRPATTFNDPSAQNATQGNPFLEPFLGDNIDLGGEWYTGEEGYVSVTLFQKTLNAFTVNELVTVPFADLGIPFESLSPTQQDAHQQRWRSGQLVREHHAPDQPGRRARSLQVMS